MYSRVVLRAFAKQLLLLLLLLRRRRRRGQSVYSREAVASAQLLFALILRRRQYIRSSSRERTSFGICVPNLLILKPQPETSSFSRWFSTAASAPCLLVVPSLLSCVCVEAKCKWFSGCHNYMINYDDDDSALSRDRKEEKGRRCGGGGARAS